MQRMILAVLRLAAIAGTGNAQSRWATAARPG